VSRIALIVGLGNPGSDYEATRHNAGFWFIDELARQNGCELRVDSKFHGHAGKVNLHGEPVWLLKPNTFMNRSGQSVSSLAKYYKIPVENILVVHDELDFEPGDVRLKKGGGHAGHNGLRDIISAMGSKEFLRLRVGIGHPGNSKDVSNFVLARPSATDKTQIGYAIDDALRVMPDLVDGNIEKAMQSLHS